MNFSLFMASSVMDDMGWVLVLWLSCSLVSMERFAKHTSLDLGFKWIMENSKSLSLLQKHDISKRYKTHHSRMTCSKLSSNMYIFSL